jgi:hypothetical protein
MVYTKYHCTRKVKSKTVVPSSRILFGLYRLNHKSKDRLASPFICGLFGKAKQDLAIFVPARKFIQ